MKVSLLTDDPEVESNTHLRRQDWCIRDVDQVVAEDLVSRYHYAGRGSNTGTHRHGLFRRDDHLTCYGVAWWMPPTKGAAIASWNGDWRKVITLSRLVVLPGVPTNGASFLLGQSIRRITQEGVWRCLVTYADTWCGHTGTIYKATNWEYVGMTNPEPVFVDQNGKMLSRKAGGHTRTRSEMAALGCTCLGKFAKHKYRIILPERIHRNDHCDQMNLFDELPAARKANP